MEAVVQKPLSNIERGRTLAVSSFGSTVINQPVEYEFVLADRRNRKLVAVFQDFLDVVSI